MPRYDRGELAVVALHELDGVVAAQAAAADVHAGEVGGRGRSRT